MKLFCNLTKIRTRQLLLVLVLCYGLNQFVTSEYIDTEKALIGSHQEVMSADELSKLISFKRDFYLLGYVKPIIGFLFKTLLSSVILLIGLYIGAKPQKLKETFKVALVGQYILWLKQALLISFILLFFQSGDLEKISKFNPFALGYYFDKDQLSAFTLPLFYKIDVFEIAYWLLLSYSMAAIMQIRPRYALKVCGLAYGSASLLWIIMASFLNSI